MRRVILASQSPRRVMLLRDDVGLADFETIPSKFNEQLDSAMDVYDLACNLALGKARDVAENHPDAWIIAGDTIVSFENKLLGKPESPEHAFTMLKMLSGRKHQVVTALALVCEELDFERVELAVADVYFAQSTDRQIWDYIETGDPMDKAGGYGIQSPEAAFLFDHFEGDKTAIIGLPVELTRQMLEREAIL